MTDTDSFVLEIKTEDVYNDFKDDILQWFDASNYPKDHPICTNVNKKVIGRRRRGSVVRVGDLNAEDLGSNPQLGLRNEFVLGDPRGKFTTLCK